MKAKTVIAYRAPGPDWECQCARCGSSVSHVECERCEDGYTAAGELHEQDPLWYDEDDTEFCSVCHGDGGWLVCISSPEWCEANPAPGREKIERGQLEWWLP